MVALHGLVIQYETNFGVIALQFLEEDLHRENAPPAAAITSTGWIVVGSGASPQQNTHLAQEAMPSSSPQHKMSAGIRPSFSSSQLSNYAGRLLRNTSLSKVIIVGRPYLMDNTVYCQLTQI